MDLPVIAYDIPVCVHIKLERETTVTLAREGAIAGSRIQRRRRQLPLSSCWTSPITGRLPDDRLGDHRRQRPRWERRRRPGSRERRSARLRPAVGPRPGGRLGSPPARSRSACAGSSRSSGRPAAHQRRLGRRRRLQDRDARLGIIATNVMARPQRALNAEETAKRSMRSCARPVGLTEAHGRRRPRPGIRRACDTVFTGSRPRGHGGADDRPPMRCRRDGGARRRVRLGKSVTSFSVVGLLPGARGDRGGRVRCAGGRRERRELSAIDRAMRRVRGERRRGCLPGADDQPQSGLDHRRADRRADPRARPLRARGARRRRCACSTTVGIPDLRERRRGAISARMSGGMRQRATIAMALACARPLDRR